MGNCFSSDKNETGDHNNSDAVPAKAIETGMVIIDVLTSSVIFAIPHW